MPGVHLLVLLAFALSSGGLPFVVVIFAEVFAVLRIEVGLGLVCPRGIGRGVGTLDLARGSLIPVVRLRGRTIELALLPLRD